MRSVDDFKPKKDFLICFDSDGCVMNTMEIKHSLCFAPCMIHQWNLAHLSEEITERWKEINLYTITRGINRYRGLALALTEIDRKYGQIKGVDKLREWAESSPELSDRAIEKEIQRHPDQIIFQKAREWSREVNRAVDALPDEKKLPFPFSREALELAHMRADIAIVSAANPDAVVEEWETQGFLWYVDVIMSQRDGKKPICIKKLCDRGYEKSRVLMCGDSEGDLLAARDNGVYFYPILARREEESFRRFISEGMKKFFAGEYGGEYQERLIAEFDNNLGE